MRDAARLVGRLASRARRANLDVRAKYHLTARIFALADNRDQSSAINGVDGSAADLGTPQYGGLIGPGNQTFSQDIQAYQLRGHTPLGAGELTADLSIGDNSIDVTGGNNSPYDLVHRDRRNNAALTWQRSFVDSQFAFGGFTPVPKLRLDGGVFASRYTTFGPSVDGRFGAI